MREIRHPASLGGARRILLYGVTGSGKSSLARRLSSATGIAWTDVDRHTWLPGWHSVPVEEQREHFTEVVALDYPRWVSLARLVRRTARRVLTRELVAAGQPPTVRLRSARKAEEWLESLSS